MTSVTPAKAGAHVVTSVTPAKAGAHVVTFTPSPRRKSGPTFSTWIPAFAGMTRGHSTSLNNLERKVNVSSSRR